MRYINTMESIRQHKAPEWYDHDKFGIFIHWGAYSVPAYAPSTWELGNEPDDESWFENNPYAEWYMNSIRLRKGPTWEHHVKTYGEDFPYERFVEMWRAENWHPKEWAKLFRASGAKYVIPVAKHHDGFCLWNSALTEYTSVHCGPHRDILEELSSAVREEGMRFGVYYSGVIDWRFAHEPVHTHYEVRNSYNISYAYSDYAYQQVIELIDRYRPSVLWNDIGWPRKGLDDLPYLFAHYYNNVSDGIVNDRWNDMWHDFTTKEYNQGEKSTLHKWEYCRGLGLSFGYNQAENESHLLSANALIHLLVDCVAFGGNLLLNVGPKADGSIPTAQEERLLALGRWLSTNGQAIYGSRPFDRPCDQMPTGETVYYTCKGDDVYAIVANPKPGNSCINLLGFGGRECARSICEGVSIRSERDGDALVLALEGIPDESAPICVCL